MITRPTPTHDRRGYTLIELVAVIVVLAIAVPSTMGMLTGASMARINAVRHERASWAASAIIEQVYADTASAADGMGFELLADDTYATDDPGGVLDRLAPVLEPLLNDGYASSLRIGPLADASGTVTGVLDQDIYRTVTAAVTYLDAQGIQRTVVIPMLMTGQTP